VSEVKSESVRVDGSDPAFARIVLSQVRASGVDMGGELWVERAHVAWVADQLEACLTSYGFEGADQALGDDALRVYESGDERAPMYNVQNQRAAGVAHGGVYALAMTRTAAETLVRDLRAL
jgi:hypothetical protein